MVKNKWFLVIFAGIVVLNLSAAFAADSNSLFLDSLSKDFDRFPKDVLADSKDTFWRFDNMTAFLVAGGVSVAMHNGNSDDKIADNFEGHQSLKEFPDRALDFIGGPAFHFGATGLWYALAAESKNDVGKEQAYIMMKALTITGTVTVGLKLAVDNETPNGKPLAWPSGHTSSSFCVASVLDEFYGPYVGIPAYVGASAVAWRMMETGDHWASDVVFGATLGWVVGHTVAGKNKNFKVGGFKLEPFYGNYYNSAVGLQLAKNF
jgi:membrane-associated phospholipid phosphatase